MRLCCPSNDGLCLFALDTKDSVIEAHRLPLQETRENTGVEAPDDFPALIRIALPEKIKDSLAIDPPLELLCTAAGKPLLNTPNSQPSSRFLATLCLYNAKSAFILELAYKPEATTINAVTTGTVLAMNEPFEPFLFEQQAGQANIVRIRPAPQQKQGHATISPPGSLAMLTENNLKREFCLSLYHGTASKPNTDSALHNSPGFVTTPLTFEMGEELASSYENAAQRVIDFCFPRSTGLGLLPSFSVLLLAGSGEVLCATPIVFDGTVVSRSALSEAEDYLSGELEALDQGSAKWRQCRAAQQYLFDVFSGSGGQNPTSRFVTARIGPGSPDSVSWPVKIQGPILFCSNESEGYSEDSPSPITIEPFGRTALVGFCIGKDAGFVDFGICSPTALLPRFALESHTDSYELEDVLFRLCSIVEQVSLGMNDFSKSARVDQGARVALIPDPVMDSCVHYVSQTMVATISTNSVLETSRLLQKPNLNKTEGSARPMCTSARLCLSASQSAIKGAAVSNDDSEHGLIVRLGNGSLVPLNVTEAQYLGEVDAALESGAVVLQREKSNQPLLLTSGGRPLPSDEALRSLESTPPLLDVVTPLIKKVQSGLSGMGKIVGTETDFKDITPEMLAVSLQIQSRCDSEVVLPLVELKREVKKRRQKLLVMLESQKEQVKDLLATVLKLKEGASSITAQLKVAESNADALSQRAASAFQASQDLLPTITQAEHDYFTDLKRLDVKSSALAEEAAAIGKEVKDGIRSTDPKKLATGVMAMDPTNIRHANDLLDDQGVTLRSLKESLDDTDVTLKKLLRRIG